uniref:Uncharacterized protein n=1 Tax=Prolemur simus TaxID=1328070 RepID=A0A8C9AXH9_PROSS
MGPPLPLPKVHGAPARSGGRRAPRSGGGGAHMAVDAAACSRVSGAEPRSPISWKLWLFYSRCYCQEVISSVTGLREL